MRLGPLWWSPLPATLDGFVYAQTASETLQRGSIEFQSIGADYFGSTFLTSTIAAVTGVPPLYVMQPLYAIIGSSTILVGMLLAWEVGEYYGWSRRRTLHTSILAGLLLAIEGIFVRRTGIPDDDALTLLLVPVAALTYYRYLHTGRCAWLAVLLPILTVIPLTQTLAALVTALVLLTVYLGMQLLGEIDTPLSAVGIPVVFWIAVIGYYQRVAPAAGLSTQYVSRISAVPGLFVAYVILLILGVGWFLYASGRLRRVVIGSLLTTFVLLVILNSQRALFPGTALTPQIVVVTLAPLVVPAIYAAWTSGTTAVTDHSGIPLLSLAVVPIVLILFSLSAGLTPEYSALAGRVQLLLHIPALVLAAIAASLVWHADSLRSRSPRLMTGVRTAVISLLIVSVVATAPAAFLNLDTGSAPSTTLQSEYDASHFAAEYLPGPWTGSHPQVRIARASYDDANATIQPTRQWLRGGTPPTCPVILQKSWATTGAHLYPAPPERISLTDYDGYTRNQSIVYSADGRDPLLITVPNTTTGC
jgi:hypothetical protein